MPRSDQLNQSPGRHSNVPSKLELEKDKIADISKQSGTP